MTFTYRPVLLSTNKWEFISLEETQKLIYYDLKQKYPDNRDSSKLDIEGDLVVYNGISGNLLILADLLVELSLLRKDYTYKLLIAPKVTEGFTEGVIVLYMEATNGILKVGKVRKTSLGRVRTDIDSIDINSEDDISCTVESLEDL